MALTAKAQALLAQRPHAVQRTVYDCGFMERAVGHIGTCTTGEGTYCSRCHLRVYNEIIDGSLPEATEP